MSREELNDWLRILAAEVRATKPKYSQNVVHGCPIPFFGKVLTARVLTIGANPSNTEFSEDRQWKEPLKQERWVSRMLDYFTNHEVPAHGWFETWSMCLEFIGFSYSSGKAAHIDVSPRPTTPMLDEITDKANFREMVENDVKWFFSLLSKLPEIRLLMVAGPVPRSNGRKQQLADFIREHSALHLASWSDGNPFPRLHTLCHPKGIPVFVCPYEPKVDGLYAMIRQVYRNREILRRLAGQGRAS